MMMIIILVTVLFLVGFINTYFNLPPTKILPYIQSFVPNSSSIISIKTKADPKENNKKKRKKSSDQENSQLKRVFTTFDKNGDGFITKQELRESLKNIGFLYTDKEVSNMVERLDVNGDGLIDIDEFCEIYESMGKGDDEVGGQDDEGGKEEELREAFDVFDGDGDGLITVEELGTVLLSLGLKQGLSVEDCKEMIRKVDMDGDGMVSFDEFKIMMKDGGKLVDIS